MHWTKAGIEGANKDGYVVIGNYWIIFIYTICDTLFYCSLETIF